MKLSFFRHHAKKCQAFGCNKEATAKVFGKDWFCDRHRDFVESEFQDMLNEREKEGVKLNSE